MTEQEVAAYKEQMFGSNGQSPTQPQPQTNQSQVPAEKKEEVVVAPAASTPVVETSKQDDEDEIVDADKYLKDTLGYDDWESAKADIAALKAKAETPAEIKYANDQSKLLFEAMIAGDEDKVYDILDTKRKLSGVENMKAADAIKLHIQQTNKNYKALDIEDVFEEKYSYPKEPVQKIDEEELEFKERHDKWKLNVEKIDRRIERDAATAKQELSKLKSEIKYPEIPKPPAAVQPNEQDEKEVQRLDAETKVAYSKLSPKDISMVFKFNDEASKLAFDIVYEPEKESFDSAIALASDPKAFFGDYYEKDGTPKRVEFLRDLYAGKNIQKIVSEAIVQAVNQERLRSLRSQKNIGDGTQRNFVLPPTSEIDRLKQQVFGN